MDLGCTNTATKLLTNFHFTTINHVQWRQILPHFMNALPIPAAPSQEAVLFRVMRKRSMIDYDLPAAKVSIKLNAPQLNSPRRFWAITATAYITKFYFLIQTLWTCKKFPVYTTPKELWLPTLNVNISIALCSKNSSSITAWGDRKAIILVDNSCLFEGIK